MSLSLEKPKYDILRIIDHYKTILDYKIHKKPVHGTTSIAFRRFRGYDKVTGEKLYGPWIYACKDKLNLLTNGGRDWMHNQVYTNSAAGTRGANFFALSNDAGAPAAADTVVAVEITTNGLARADASGGATHSAGTNTTSIVFTWTCTTAAQAAQKAGSLTAASAGILVHENTFTSVSLQVNDQLQLTWTFTLG